MLFRNARLFVPVIAAALTAFFFVAGSAEAQTLKIGTFDPDRIAAETAEGSRIKARLSSFQNSKRAELEEIQQEIERLQQEVVNTAASLSSERRKELLISIRKKQAELESLQKVATQELQIEVEEAELEWQERVLNQVRLLGTEQGYTVILQRDLVAFSTPLIDVTDELIARIDAEAAAANGQ